MSFLSMFLAVYPACAAFVALALLIARARQRRQRRHEAAYRRVAEMPDDPRPRTWLGSPTLPWKLDSWHDPVLSFAAQEPKK